MTSRNAGKADNGLKLIAAFAVALFVLAAGSVMLSNDSAEADPAYRHSITYNPNGAGGSEVTVSYDGIAATEYNPLYWAGSFSNSSGVLVNSNWIAPAGSTNYNSRTFNNVGKVFAGWSTIADFTSNSAVIYDPGDVVPSDIDTLYAVWVFPWGQISNNNLVTYVNKGTTTNYYQPSDSFSQSVSQMYTKQYYISGNLTGNLPAGSYRSQSLYTGSGNVSAVTITGNVTFTGDVILDNVELGCDRAANNNHGYSTNRGLYGNSHKMIIGTGITNPTITDPLRAPIIFGGGTGDSTATVVSGKHIVSRTDDFDDLSVNLGSFVIIHSGTYYAVMAGGRDNMGAANNPLSTYLVFKKATVLDTVGGGNSTDGGTGYRIYGSTTYGTQYDPYQGGTFVYAIGLTTISDMWAAQETGYSGYNSVTTNEGCNFQGGCSTGQVYGSTHVFVSGTASVWDVQGGGRAGNAFSGFTYVEISGSAEVRHAACGSVTDGTDSAVTCTNGTKMVVRDNPTIAMLFGAGYDTWANPTASNMTNGKSITVDIAGGTIGFVYGGGYRGTIGSTTNSISVSVSVTGGTVVYDVFGGGRGGVDKMIRTTTGKDPSGSGYLNSTGRSVVYGDVNVNIGGDAVILGNVYGGGESVPLITRYYGITNFSNNETNIAVAEVTGNTSVTVSGNASISGNVYGAGKGINLSDGAVVGTYTPVTGSEVADYYTKNITISRSYVSGDYALQRDGGNVTLAFHFLDWYNHSSESGSITYNSTPAVLEKYLEFAMTEKNGSVTVTGNASIAKSVYGGGAFSRVLMGTSATINSDRGTAAVGEDVFGGGLGRVGTLSVNQNSSATLTKGIIGRDIYGGSAYGTVTLNTSTTINGGTVNGDAYGGGLGLPNEDSVYGNSVFTLNNGTVRGTAYGGSAYGIVNGNCEATIVSGTIMGSLYGGGLGEEDKVSVRGNTAVNVSGGSVEDSVFGGSAYGIVVGNLYVTVIDGSIGGSVYGGGLGREGSISTYGKRYVYIRGGTVTGSVFGGSSVGDDKAVDGSVNYDTSGSVAGSNSYIEIPKGQAYTIETMTFTDVLMTPNSSYSTARIELELYNSSGNRLTLDSGNLSDVITVGSVSLTYNYTTHRYSAVASNVNLSANLYSKTVNSTALSSLNNWFVRANLVITDYDSDAVVGTVRIVPVSVEYTNPITVSGTSTTANSYNVHESQAESIPLTFSEIYSDSNRNRNFSLRITVYDENDETIINTITTNASNNGTSISSNYFGGTVTRSTESSGWFNYNYTITCSNFQIKEALYNFQYDGKALSEYDGYYIKIVAYYNQQRGPSINLYPISFEDTVTYTGATTELHVAESAATTLNPLTFTNILNTPKTGLTATAVWSLYSSSGAARTLDSGALTDYITVGSINASRNSTTGNYTVTLNNVQISASLYSAQVNGRPLSAYGGYYIQANVSMDGHASLGGAIQIYPLSNNRLDSDALVVISEAVIGQSVYGGGFMGNTYGSTAVYLGYTYDGIGTPQPNTGSGENPVITLGGSIYAGGDVGESLDAFTVPLVHGDGRVYVNGNHTDITVPGSIMASGNSCLTAGNTSIELWYFDDPVDMFGIHRADTVLLYATDLEITGMYSKIGDGLSSVEKMCSLSHIGALTMQAESAIHIGNPMEDVAQYRSLTRDGTPTTVSSPFNKIVFTAGSTLFIRANDGSHITYGAVMGYTVLSVADNAPFGGYVLGHSVNSTGGFVILHDGSYTVADYSDYSGNVRCWFIAGVESKVITLSLPYGAGQQSVSGSVDIIKLLDTSDLTYTGGIFIPYNDGYSFVRPGQGTGDNFGLMFGYMDGDSNTALVSNKTHYLGLTQAENSWKYSTFFMGDASVSDESGYTGYDSSNPAMDGALYPAVLRTGTVSGTSSASPTAMDATFTPDANGRAGTFSLNIMFCGSPSDKTDYLGYVILYIQEITTMTYIDDEGEHTEAMVSNRIELHVDLYTIGSDLHDYNDLTIDTVGGAGEVSFLFNTGMRNYSVYLLSSDRSNDESGVALSVQGVRNVGNNTGWKDTNPIFSVEDFNLGQDLNNLKEIGTLNGGFIGTARLSVSGFDSAYDGMTFTVVLVLKDGEGNWVMDGGNVKKVQLNITIVERPPVIVTFYDYTQGITIETGGTEIAFLYGTSLTEAQCPPVLENFIGWYTDENFVNIYTFNTPLVKDISLFARYTYTVTFDYQNGTTSQMHVASSPEGVRISAPPSPERSGYSFEGWYKQSSCLEPWDFSRDRVTGNVTLYAKWVGEQVRIIFKDASGNTLDYRITTTGSSLVPDADLTGDLTGPFVRYGETFDVIDLYYSTYVREDVNILDGAKTLLNSSEIFIKWTAETADGSTLIAIYKDTQLNDVLIDMNEANWPTVDGKKVIYLSAVTSKVAVLVKMEAVTTDLDAICGDDEDLREHLIGKVNTTDLSASVAAPAEFLIYPGEEVNENTTVFTFTFSLNDATRSGWSLYGWHNTHVTSTYATYPAAGLERVIRLTTEKYDGHIYVMEEELYKNGQWIELITYAYGHHDTDNRLDNPAEPYTIRYIALWEQIEYTVTISNTAHGIVDAYYINSSTGEQTPGTTFHVHYGDRIKLVFTPEERYDFYRWTYYGECSIEDPTSAVTTMVVTGDAIIYASDTGERVVRLYATFDGTDTTAPENMYLRDSVTGEYVTVPRNATSDQANNALYRAYVVTGTYYVCIRDGNDDYVFGTAVIGTGETTYHYTIYNVLLDIEDDEHNAVGVGTGVTHYTKYIGKEADSEEILYGSITVSEGYTYNLNQGYIEEVEGVEVYHLVNNLGDNAVGVLEDTVLNYRLHNIDDNTRIIWGNINPITFTVSFVVGQELGDTTWIDPYDSSITVPTTLASVTVKYGETFENKLPDASDISYHDNDLGTDGHISDRSYAVYNWYLRHTGSGFTGAVYENTTLNATFMSEFLVGELSNNSFTLYSWIIKNVDEITITYTVSRQQADDGNAYDVSQVYNVTFISVSANTYTGIFARPAPIGFKTYTEMGYTGPTDLGDWMTITATYGAGQSGSYTYSITVSETDIMASFTFTGDTPSIAMNLKYDRMTALIYMDLGEYGQLGTGAQEYLTANGWTTVTAGRVFSIDARYGQTLYAPWLQLKNEYSEYYNISGWDMIGGTGSITYDVPVPGTDKTTYSYQVTLDDVQNHAAHPDTRITFSVIYEAISIFALTFITPIGTFSNGYQRRTVYLTPAQDTSDFIEIPTYDSNYYDWLGWNVQPPQHLTHDQEIVGTWYVRQHTLTFSVGAGSEDRISVSATRDQYAAASGTAYNHHSEIILTIVPGSGWTLDLASTLAASTADLGEPVFVSDDRGYRWTFFLDKDVDITVYATKATIPVHFLVNGNIWETQNLVKYEYCYFDLYTHAGYSSTSGWFTDPECTVAYTATVTDPNDPNYGRYYIQVISETTFYTQATPNTYFIIYHPNNETETSAFDTDAGSAISAYISSGTALPDHIQAVTYGEGFRLNDKTYSWEDCLMEGWVMLSGEYDSAPANRMLAGRMTNLMRQTFSDDLTLFNYDGGKGLYDDENGVIHMYAYYVSLDIPEATYDGQEHSGSIVKKTDNTASSDLTVYYSASILNASNYSSAGTTTPITFTDAGNHVMFYYGWVTASGDDTQKSVLQGAMTVTVAKRTVVFTSGSASRGFIEGTSLSNETVTYGNGIVAGEQAGLSYTFTYEDSAGTAPVAQGTYRNTFTVIFDGVRIKSTNYDWSQVIGTLTITASADNIKVQRTASVTYGDGTYTLVWTDDGQPGCQKDNVDYTSADPSVVTVSTNGTITILAAGDTSIRVAMKDDASVFVDVQVTVAKKGLDFTVTLSSSTKMYDGTATLPSTPAISSVSGIVAGDTGLVTYTVTGRYSTTHAGNAVPLEFTITIGGDKGDNYTSGTVTKPSTGIITQRSIVINTGSASKVFDDTALTATYTLSGDGFVNGQGFSAVNVTGTLTDVGSTPNTLGGYTFNNATTTASDYNVTTNIGTLTVTVRTVTIPTGGSYTYTGETIAAAIATSPYYVLSGQTSGKDKATYTAYADLKYNDRGVVNVKWSDDTTSQKTILWYIVAAAINWNYFSFQSETYYYDGEAYEPALTYIGPDDARRYVLDVDYSLTYVNNVNATVSEGSTYLLVTGLGGYVGSNHTYTFVISPRGVNVTVNTHQSYEYDHTEKVLVYSVDDPTANSGFLNGHAEQVSVTNGAKTDAGTYTSVFSITGGTPTNYHLYLNGNDVSSVNWSITKKAVYVVCDTVSFMYDGTEHNVVTSSTGLIDGDDAELSCANYLATHSGDYAASFSITGTSSANYVLYVNGVNITSVAWEVSTRPIYIITASAWKAFDGTALTESGYSSFGILAAEAQYFDITISGTQTAVGYSTNTITCELTGDLEEDDYEIHLITGTLIVIAPQCATVTMNLVAPEPTGAPAAMAVVRPSNRRLIL